MRIDSTTKKKHVLYTSALWLLVARKIQEKTTSSRRSPTHHVLSSVTSIHLWKTETFVTGESRGGEGRCLGRDGHVCTGHRQLGGARPLEHGATLHDGEHHPFVACCSSPIPLGVTAANRCVARTVHCVCTGGGRGTRRLNPRNKEWPGSGPA